jgi:hypothetical protein
MTSSIYLCRRTGGIYIVDIDSAGGSRPCGRGGRQRGNREPAQTLAVIVRANQELEKFHRERAAAMPVQ